MKYMILLFSDADATGNLSPEEMQADMEAHGRFAQLVAQRGGEFHGEALLAPNTAHTLRKQAGEVVVTDGPFVELKEHVGGYYLFEADTEAEALELARHCPVYAANELRPVWDMSGLG